MKKQQIGNKIFFDINQYDNYKKYLDILNLPLKAQKLLWYTRGQHNIPDNFSYFDKFEDVRKNLHFKLLN